MMIARAWFYPQQRVEAMNGLSYAIAKNQSVTYVTVSQRVPGFCF